jgi:SNF2 family DNA or RNA helicase
MKIKPKDTIVKTILESNFLVIPRFQRPYSWDTDNIADFWEDVFLSSDEDSFIGSMVLYRDNELSSEAYVVDGQQRLMTTTVLFAVIRDLFLEMRETNLPKGLQRIIERQDINNKDRYTLTSQDPDPFFQDRIQSFEHSGLDYKIGEEERNIKNCYDELYERAKAGVDEERKKDRQIQFLQKLRDRALSIKVITVDLDNEDDAYLLATLQRLQPPEAKPKAKGNGEDEKRADVPRRRINIFQTKSNFDHSEFKRQLRERKLGDSSPPAMKVRLKTHQVEGVEWLTNCYLAGWPGVLLADDMGLGKTLQSLSFLILLRREGVIKRGYPALVVAPTSLLRNWQDEHSKHTLDEGLGKPLVAFGNQLRNVKLGSSAVDGIMLLDTGKIAESNWVLTTYETVRDYHMSFARIPFSVAVLDEIQKAKNPSTRINATLKTLNVDFVLSMTGTPVENSISDLWAISDITAPGYFAPLREFMKAFGKVQETQARQQALEKLSGELLQKAEIDGHQVPAYALRRLKEDVAKDLPPKHQGPMIRADMPSAQAQRYADVSAATQAGKIKILRALHDFRSISLHPVDPDSVTSGLMQGDEYIKMSARLSQAFAKLEQIALRNEKVIIFVNSRRMQTVLSRLVERKFGCSKPEYIRGDTIPGQRQEIVNRFSALAGFAALILSPRASGVGLNIVAANHVIHLDRWWNPAVEDQCTDRAYRIGATKEVFVHTVGAVHASRFYISKHPRIVLACPRDVPSESR